MASRNEKFGHKNLSCKVKDMTLHILHKTPAEIPGHPFVSRGEPGLLTENRTNNWEVMIRSDTRLRHVVSLSKTLQAPGGPAEWLRSLTSVH